MLYHFYNECYDDEAVIYSNDLNQMNCSTVSTVCELATLKTRLFKKNKQ